MTTLSLDSQEWRLLALDNIDRMRSFIAGLSAVPNAQEVAALSAHVSRVNVLFRAWHNSAAPAKAVELDTAEMIGAKAFAGAEAYSAADEPQAVAQRELDRAQRLNAALRNGAGLPPLSEADADALMETYKTALNQQYSKTDKQMRNATIANGATPELVISKRKRGRPKGSKNGPSKTATRAAAQ